MKSGKKECIFREDGTEECLWHCSNCNEEWLFYEGTPEDNELKYCPHCGAKVTKYENYIEGEIEVANKMEEDLIEKLQKEIEKLQKENEELKADNYEYQRIQDIFDERTYRKKYLEERREENPNLLYPDADEIYERYYKFKKENEELKELTNKTQWISPCYVGQNYISKQKVKDKIEELKRFIYTGENAPQDFLQYRIKAKIQALQELLEGR